MRWQRIIFLAAIVAAAACGANKQEIQSAKHSLFDTDFATVYGAAVDATRESYPNLEDAPGRGAIKTAWHQVASNNNDDVTNQKVVGAGAGAGTPNSPAAAGMPTRLSYKRYFIRFDVTVAGGRPWRLKVVGHAADWEPGTAQPNELHGNARPSWLDGRTDALLVAIYHKVQKYAVPMKDTPEETDDLAGKKADPKSFHDVPPEAARKLATLKDALASRDFEVIRKQLADNVVWSLGGEPSADTAISMWQADSEPLEIMSQLLLAGCAGEDKKVTCPPAAPTSGNYQLVLELRPEGWLVTSFAKAE